MKKISISELPSTSLLIKDYLHSKQELAPFYGREFTYENLLKQSKEKLYSYTHREILTTELKSQLSNINLTEIQQNNLEKLSLNNTVTITTGHQLNLMTGPLYFIYKILHVIKLCNTLNAKQNEINFVPVFWMATEDHDFDEINHFTFQNKKISWNEDHQDFVGRIPTDTLKSTLQAFYDEIKYFPHGKDLRQIIEKSYFSAKNLADATRILVHEIFKDFGLLMIDGDSHSLKQVFSPYIKDDLLKQQSFHSVSDTIKKLQDNYKIQVNPREINFFYREDNQRNRIEKVNDNFHILNTNKKFTQNEILKELEDYPEKFSPNALMRPVYQETILPNVAYIGGNAEISYWLELKEYFNTQNLHFPILIPRNSFLILTENQHRKLNNYSIDYIDLFSDREGIIKKIVNKVSEDSFDFDKYKQKLTDIFDDLLNESSKTDVSWKNMILAQQKKQLNGLDKINKRFHKAERLKHSAFVANFETLYSELFPKGTWQERIENFSYYYLIQNQYFIKEIYTRIPEFETCINIIII